MNMELDQYLINVITTTKQLGGPHILSVCLEMWASLMLRQTRQAICAQQSSTGSDENCTR